MLAIEQQTIVSPAEKLVGITLLDNWHVQERIRHNDGLSGSTRSTCYRAKSTKGEYAFVKAFDFPAAAVDTDTLEKMVREYNYERDVHYFCSDSNIKRVTRIYGANRITIDGSLVHFIICEWENKCLREHQPLGQTDIPPSERFKALRDIASALSQLHKAGIAHQDVKPSNAVCSDLGLVKLTDLGSSSCLSLKEPPHDSDCLVGQPSYAPYELLYEAPPNEWESRRFGCDLFLLGNLCFTSFTGVSLSYIAVHWTPEYLKHINYTGSYSEVLPHLLEAHEVIIPLFLKETCNLPDKILKELTELISCLCHPDPSRRGHTKSLQHNNQYSLERIVSKLDYLATGSKVLLRATK